MPSPDDDVDVIVPHFPISVERDWEKSVFALRSVSFFEGIVTFGRVMSLSIKSHLAFFAPLATSRAEETPGIFAAHLPP